MYTVNVQHGIALAPDGVHIAYQVSGQGPALVCCHAMANDHRMFDLHRDVFSKAHTLITFDQRGSGESDHPPFTEGYDSAYSVEKFGEDLKAVLDEIGIERASVLGFSMGAIAALSFSTRWPNRVARLVLASAMASRLPQSIIDRARLVEDKLDTDGLDETYDFYFSGALFQGILQRKELQEQIAQFRSRATPHGFKGCFRVTIDRPSLVAKLELIQCPTLVLVGENDEHYLAEADRLQRTIPNAKKVVVRNVGHAMPVQDPAAFEAQVLKFLA